MFTRTVLLALALFSATGLVGNAQEGMGRRVAVLVGVQQYGDSGLSNLKYAENDVHSLAEVLREQGFQRVLLLTRSEWRRTDRDDRLPTAENIRATLQAELGDLKAGDSVVVAFAGHGAHLKAHDKLFFCPAKANLDKPETLVPLDEVYSLLKTCKAGTKVLFVDACRNDPADGRTAMKLDLTTRPLVPDPPGGIVALFSCSKGQVAYESDRNQRGFLFHFVNEGLRGKAAHPTTGEVTWPRLVTYVTEELPAAVRDERSVNVRQTPEYFGTGRDLVLARVLAGESTFRRALQFQLGLDGEPCDERKAAALYREAAERGHPLAQACMAAFHDFGYGGIAIDRAEAQRLGTKCLEGVRKIADTGRADAQNLMGVLYYRGLGVQADPKESARWHQLAAEQGLAVAMSNLANHYMIGKGVEANPAEGVRWLRRAVALNLATAMTELGVCYSVGRGVDQDDREAFRLFRKAAEQNQTGGMIWLGYCYESGRGVEKDAAEAFRWYRKAADQDDAEAINTVGSCLQNGIGVPKDDREAVRWFRKGAELGFADSQSNLGWMYEMGRGVKQDLKEAVQWYRKAADQGFAAAQNNLGHCFLIGRGVEKDEPEAVRWFRKAADQNHLDALTALGDCYYYGTGVDADAKEAVRCYRKAADAGFALAQVSLGLLYVEGRGVAKDEKEAVKWYHKAADQDNAEAQCLLAACYADGVGIARDDREAVKWYRRAAEKNYPDGQFNLGVWYEQGRGVPKDLRMALQWYRKAADLGHEEAKEAVRRLGGK